MGNVFFAYLQQLELMAFFSGYPLMYAVVLTIAGKKELRNAFKNKLVSLLPYAYAVVGALYIGLQIKNLYPDYSLMHIRQSIQQPYLISWGVLSILFWIPALSKRTFISLIHSLIFFYFIVRDLFFQLVVPIADKDMIRNDMKIYSISLLLNLGALALTVLFSFLWLQRSKRPRS